MFVVHVKLIVGSLGENQCFIVLHGTFCSSMVRFSEDNEKYVVHVCVCIFKRDTKLGTEGIYRVNVGPQHRRWLGAIIVKYTTPLPCIGSSEVIPKYITTFNFVKKNHKYSKMQ
jgi:hypothetical protein